MIGSFLVEDVDRGFRSFSASTGAHGFAKEEHTAE